MEKLKEHTHYVVYVVLVVVILLLFSREKQGRYAVTSAGKESWIVLDTKTSQLWLRGIEGSICFGTNENPTHKLYLVDLKSSTVFDPIKESAEEVDGFSTWQQSLVEDIDEEDEKNQ